MRTIRVIGAVLLLSIGVTGTALSQCPNWDAQTGKIVYDCSGGNVGIGTTAPPSKLTVSGGAIAVSGGTQGDPNGYSYSSGASTTQIGYDMTAAAGFIQAAHWGIEWRPLLLNPYAGNVGIGTAVPAAPLDVEAGAYDGVPTTVLRVSTKGIGYSGSGAAIELAAWNNRGGPEPVGKIAVSLYNGAVNQQTGDMLFYTANAGQLSSRMRILSNGDVRIGTDTAAGNLNVTGNIVASGSITGLQVIGATYQDVAEWVPATTNMDAGTVVVLNPEHDNEVKPSDEPYDTRVAGVVSANPGVILGVGASGKEKIATTGRVTVRVDATHAPIRIGDLLVTSDVSGTAMKSQPIDVGGTKIHRPGTVIGKALQALPSGRGEILVLLSLQ